MVDAVATPARGPAIQAAQLRDQPRMIQEVLVSPRTGRRVSQSACDRARLSISSGYGGDAADGSATRIKSSSWSFARNRLTRKRRRLL